MTDLVVGPIALNAVRYAVTSWHYSHSMPLGAQQGFGVFEDGRYIGAVLFGRGGNLHLGRPLGLGPLELVELTRIALREHDTPVSRIVPVAVEQLKASSPKLRAVVSFADPWHGHHGGIYQAMNWLYLGMSIPMPMFREIGTGKLHHNRVVARPGNDHRGIRQFGRLTRGVPADSVEQISVPGKHRYVLPLDRGMRRRLVPRSLPYPHAVEVSTATH